MEGAILFIFGLFLGSVVFIAGKSIWDMTVGSWLERVNKMLSDFNGSYWSHRGGMKDKVENLSNDIGDLYKADLRLEKRIKALESHIDTSGTLADS